MDRWPRWPAYDIISIYAAVPAYRLMKAVRWAAPLAGAAPHVEIRRLLRSGVPLYYQLATVLREEIISGQRRIGDKLPSESDLERMYRVSRMTVREALRSLEGEGLIRREAGRGSFVSGLPAFTGNLQMDGTLNGLISMGLATAPKLLELREVELTPEDAEALGMGPTTAIVR